jgi:superfamily II DNA or RNA helicase
MALTLRFEAGTVLLTGGDETSGWEAFGLTWDRRSLQWRAPAVRYRDVVMALKGAGVVFDDQARQYEARPFPLIKKIEPRQHQQLAIDAWLAGGGRGVVSLPTGAGKTVLAVMVIAKIQRSTLVVVPTIDLVRQWQAVLTGYFGEQVGALGGGSKEILPLTVATYDSALLFIESIGQKFGCIVFDECHHLPAPQNQNIALGALAPFRLGLSATVERADGKEEFIFENVGPMLYQAQIREMDANVLSAYDVVTIKVALSDEERQAYTAARQTYLNFVKKYGINFNSPRGWLDFVIKSSRLPDGKLAMQAYRNQKKMAQTATGKFRELWEILGVHDKDQVIVFTDDNALAYRIGREFVLPVLTHQTKLAERKTLLDAFRSQVLKVLVTSKVLNEGVDVPNASVGIVVSGSGGVREHVQRLGRILRHQPGKRAVLYELISEKTSEQNVNQRRRQHHAYEKSPSI